MALHEVLALTGVLFLLGLVAVLTTLGFLHERRKRRELRALFWSGNMRVSNVAIQGYAPMDKP